MTALPLSSGTRIGTYEIVAAIGAGGMGEVYRARDTRLSRDVAIKILPDGFRDDPDRLARFEREARILASLNHPHIGAIHGLEKSGALTALIMELVEGDDLSHRLSLGRLPATEALTVARQIAEALEATHARGVVHRDLKPANVKVRPDGTVKVLDFGLARMEAAPAVDASLAPTLTATVVGVVMGTPAYMSPEQVRGEVADSQSDVWAFGAMLFELLTGVSPFGRPTTPDTLATVLNGSPDYSLLPSATPPAVRRLIHRCLEPDRKRRLQHIGDARIELDDALTAPVGMAPDARPVSRASMPLLLAAAVGLLAVGAGSMRYLGGTPGDVTASGASRAVTWSRIDPPGRLTAALTPDLALSPDGRRLAIAAVEPNGRRMLWVRELGSLAARALEGTEEAEAPFWSFDGASIAFFARGRLLRVNASGGPVSLIAEPAYAAPGAWGPGNVILFTPAPDSPLSKVHAGGGAPSPVTALDAGQATHVYPFFLPDGRGFLYAAWSATGLPLGVWVGSLDSTERTALLGGVPNAQFASGHLVYVREQTLVARAFDASRRAFTSDDVVPIADQVNLGSFGRTATLGARAGAFFVSADTLIYHTALSPLTRLVWLDRRGIEVGSIGRPAVFGDLSLAPNDRRALVSIAEGPNRDIWIFDTERGTGTRVTFDPDNEFVAVFSPDGQRFAYDSNRSGVLNLYERPLSAAGEERVLREDRDNKFLLDWAETMMVYITVSGPGAEADLWTLPVSGDRTPQPFVKTPFREGYGAQVSPDGRWIAYPSDKSSRMEVYVSPYPPAPDRERQVSIAGGGSPRWGSSGRELYYFEAASSQLMTVPLEYRGGDVVIGDVRPLFKVQPAQMTALFYDVARDGQRFLVNTPVNQDATSHLTLIQNWPALITRTSAAR